MQVNPDDGPPEIYVTWSDPRMTDFENVPFFRSPHLGGQIGQFLSLNELWKIDWA